MTSKTVNQRLIEALGLALKHVRCDSDCGSSYYRDGIRSCACGKAQDSRQLFALFTDDEWKGIRSGNSPVETKAQHLLQDYFGYVDANGTLSSVARTGAENFALWLDDRRAVKTSAEAPPSSKDVPGPRLEDIRQNGDAREYSLRVDVMSDAPEKVQRFCQKIAELILAEPGYGNHDVAVSVHQATAETAAPQRVALLERIACLATELCVSVDKAAEDISATPKKDERL
jgi:hypothetical protein